MVDQVRRTVGFVPDLLVSTYHDWRRHRTIRLGAGLAYYGLFALVPLVAVSLSVAGLFVATEDVQDYLATQLADFVGNDADTVGQALADAMSGAGTTLGLGALGLLSLAFTASLLVLALQDALNSIWERPVRSGVRHSLVRRLVAFAVVFACGAVLVASFAVNAVTGLIGSLAPDVRVWVPLTELIGTAATWVIGIGVIALLFRYLTDVRVPWPSVLAGATVTALLVAVGTVAIGAYLRRYAAASLLGATGSVFLVLLWIYYEAQILLAGAEFTRALAQRSGFGRSLDDDRESGAPPGDDVAADVAR
jgi:membrane protein